MAFWRIQEGIPLKNSQKKQCQKKYWRNCKRAFKKSRENFWRKPLKKYGGILKEISWGNPVGIHEKNRIYTKIHSNRSFSRRVSLKKFLGGHRNSSKNMRMIFCGNPRWYIWKNLRRNRRTPRRNPRKETLIGQVIPEEFSASISHKTAEQTNLVTTLIKYRTFSRGNQVTQRSRNETNVTCCSKRPKWFRVVNSGSLA